VDTGDRKHRTVAVSPASRIAAGGFLVDKTHVIDLTTRRAVDTLDADASTMTFTSNGDRLVLVDFAGHGKVFATGGDEAADEPVLAVASQPEVALLDLRESTWRDVACDIADSRLTRDEWERLVPGRGYAPACG